LRWNKAQSRYRPIICYELEVKTDNGHVQQAVRIGVVHTTPSGNEAVRVGVYDQIDKPLRHLARSPVPLVVGGDFYLTAEAVTRAFHVLTPKDQGLARRTLAQYRKSLETKRDELAKTERRMIQEQHWDEAQEIHDQQVHLESLISRYREGAIQAIRNDATLQISVEKRIQALGLEVAQPLAGTNWKTKQVDRWFDAQIADFFVHTGPHSTHPNSHWQKTRVGIVDLTEGLRLSDESSLDLAQQWALISDHCPVGITLSMDAKDRWVDHPFHHLDRMVLWARLHELATEMKRQGASAAGGEQTGTLVPPGEIPHEGDAALAGVIVRRPSSGEYVAYLRHGDRWLELASDSSILRDPGDVA
jgi:endonuclease/exonuclease/phosphatase family metal-dependent hydrolase